MSDEELLVEARAMWQRATIESREEAVQLLRDRCAQGDADLELQLMLGNWLLNLDYTREAVHWLEKAVAREPTCWGAWVSLAHAREDLGLYIDALAAYENALSVTERATTLTCAASMCYRTDQLHKAELYYRRALLLDAENDEALVGLGLVLRAQKDIAGARLLFTQASKVFPGSVQALRELALLIEDLDERVRLLRKAATLDSGDFWTWMYLGMAYVAKGSYRDALAALSCADELDTYGEPLVLKYRALALEGLGDTAQAKRMARRAIELGSDDTEVVRIAGQ